MAHGNTAENRSKQSLKECGFISGKTHGWYMPCTLQEISTLQFISYINSF